jgi:hypothetical protein
VEMIHALTVPSDVNSQPSAAAVTILLHDRHFADMARNVRHGLADDRHHAAVCREIPSMQSMVRCWTLSLPPRRRRNESSKFSTRPAERTRSFCSLPVRPADPKASDWGIAPC